MSRPFRFPWRTPIPGTELYDYAKANGYILNEGARWSTPADTRSPDRVSRSSRRLRHGDGASLLRRVLISARRHDSASSCKAIFKSDERKRLYKEAKEFMKLRAARNKAVKAAREKQHARETAVVQGD